MIPHTPDHLSMVRIPITYDPQAGCPEWDQFIVQVFPDDSHEIAYELPAWMMTPSRAIQASALLLGAGGNGKSTYLEALRRFLGRTNTSSITLQRLEIDRFAASAIFGKLANIAADLPGESLKSTSAFKMITGGDEILGEYKFKDTFSFRPFCKLIFSANRMPQSPDDTDGFFRRWVCVPFTATFYKGGPETLPQDVILRKLTAPAELSGFLNKVLEADDRLRANRSFTESGTMTESAIEMRRTSDPFAVFLDEHTILAPTGFIRQTELRRRYAEECTRAGRSVPSAVAITQMLKHLRPGVELRQKKVTPDDKPWCYFGVGWLVSEPQNQELSTSRSEKYWWTREEH